MTGIIIIVAFFLVFVWCAGLTMALASNDKEMLDVYSEVDKLHARLSEVWDAVARKEDKWYQQ